jgi:hypothetical protein
MKGSELTWSLAKFSEVYLSVVSDEKCNEVKCSEVMRSEVKFIYWNAVKCSELERSAVKWSEVQWREVVTILNYLLKIEVTDLPAVFATL